jgi:acetyl-CoA carboxylase biotin carboxylase subunit
MVSKLICRGRNRDEAISRMERALSEFVVKGIKTSIPFHRRVMKNEKFRSGNFDTSFIETEMSTGELLSAPGDEEERGVAVMLVGVAAYRRDRELAARARTVRGPAVSRWKAAGRARQMRTS